MTDKVETLDEELARLERAKYFMERSDNYCHTNGNLARLERRIGDCQRRIRERDQAND